MEILEYCEESEAINREQYYLDLCEPEYNILKIAGSSLGYKYSEESRVMMSSSHAGKKHSEETRAKISSSQKTVNRLGEKNPMFGKARSEGSGRPSQRISVLNVINNNTSVYDSINAAALALGIKPTVISKYFINNQKKPYKGKYIFKKV